MIVNPASGALVRDPATKLALAPGAEVNLNDPYWARLFADGDIVPDGGEVPAEAVAPAEEGAASDSAIETHSSEDVA